MGAEKNVSGGWVRGDLWMDKWGRPFRCLGGFVIGVLVLVSLLYLVIIVRV